MTENQSKNRKSSAKNGRVGRYVNVYCKLREHHSKKFENAAIDMVSSLTVVSTASIYQMKTKFKKFGNFPSPGKKRPLKKRDLAWKNMIISL